MIHRCSIRPLTAQDVAACGWLIQPTRLPVDGREARERLRRIVAGYPERPKAGRPFVVKTTDTPMTWIPPGTFEMGSRGSNGQGRHLVRLTKGCWMAQIEVTQGAYKEGNQCQPQPVHGLGLSAGGLGAMG